MPGGKIQEAGEYYPGSSAWGRHGWTCFSLDEAQALAQTLTADTPPQAATPGLDHA